MPKAQEIGSLFNKSGFANTFASIDVNGFEEGSLIDRILFFKESYFRLCVLLGGLQKL